MASTWRDNISTLTPIVTLVILLVGIIGNNFFAKPQASIMKIDELTSRVVNLQELVEKNSLATSASNETTRLQLQKTGLTLDMFMQEMRKDVSELKQQVEKNTEEIIELKSR